MIPYRIIRSSEPLVPIVISIPHCGTDFPEEIRSEYHPELIQHPDDTDWFVDRLYSIATELGITIIHATISRWVIDLNRNPDNSPLYSDGRIITGLCPVTSFAGEPLYLDNRKTVSETDTEHRKAIYFTPYHKVIEQELIALKEKFNHILLWDCHSIRRQVATIQKDPFPDLILGTAKGSACHPNLEKAALEALKMGPYEVSLNHPFQGGYITRHNGRPGKGIHAIQLEMSKDLYMDPSEKYYDVNQAFKIQSLLTHTLETMIEKMGLLNQK